MAKVIEQRDGKLTFLRSHDVGTGFGPDDDFIDVEAVIGLDTAQGMGFGFQLRPDGSSVAHQGELDLLRDAFNNNWTVTIDYEIEEDKKNGVIVRTTLTKQ